MRESAADLTGSPGDRPAIGTSEELPFIDAHTIEVNATTERVWDQAARNVLPRFGGGAGLLGRGLPGRAGARLLGCPHRQTRLSADGIPETIVGFQVAQAHRPTLIMLDGEHRYARYTLTLHIKPIADGSASRLIATTRACFPGPAGRRYRRLVIGTGGHVFAVRRLLWTIRRRAERG